MKARGRLIGRGLLHSTKRANSLQVLANYSCSEIAGMLSLKCSTWNIPEWVCADSIGSTWNIYSFKESEISAFKPGWATNELSYQVIIYRYKLVDKLVNCGSLDLRSVVWL